MFRYLACASVLLSLSIAPAGSPIANLAALDPASGSILAPVARQVGWLNMDAPRPLLLTRFAAPNYVADLAVSTSGVAVLAVQSSLPGQAGTGGDLLSLDLTSASTVPLVERVDAGESFGWPAWAADGSWLFFQRDDQRSPPTAFAGQSAVRYPSRIERFQTSNRLRQVVVDDARQPALSPDDSQLAFVRSSAQGTALLERSLVSDSSENRELVSMGAFPDLAYPRFSPRGDQIAFMAAAPLATSPPLLGAFLSVRTAYAHGLPWDLWLIDADGSNHQLAALGADDPSLSWSPDGKQIFVYGGAGSFLVDATTGEAVSYPYLAGYGATAWVLSTSPVV